MIHFMRRDTHQVTRREFLAASAAGLLQAADPVPIIDIHQHTHYSGRPDDVLVKHQRTMGIRKTVLLPAGSKYGLAADAYGNDSVVELARKYPDEFVFFANELPDIPETRRVLEKYLRMGAIGIGEQKFPVECDSKHIQLVAEIAQEFGVPVLLHFQHETYNLGFERFHKVLEKFPKVNFMGHAQTWWGNIEQDDNQTVMYPKSAVTPGESQTACLRITRTCTATCRRDRGSMPCDATKGALANSSSGTRTNCSSAAIAATTWARARSAAAHNRLRPSGWRRIAISRKRFSTAMR